ARRCVRGRTPAAATAIPPRRVPAAWLRRRWPAAPARPRPGASGRRREPPRRPRRATATARGWTGACGYGWVGASESLLRASSGGLRVRVGAVSAGRFDALQVAPEEIRLAAVGVVDRSGGA